MDILTSCFYASGLIYFWVCLYYGGDCIDGALDNYGRHQEEKTFLAKRGSDRSTHSL